MDTRETRLTVSSDLGKTLLEAALVQNQKDMQDQCIAEVQTVLSLINITKVRIEDQHANLILFQDRLMAIEAGEIKLGHYSNGLYKIVYKNEELNRQPIAPK